MLGGGAVLQRQLPSGGFAWPLPEPRGQRLPPSLPVLFRVLKDAEESQRRPAEINTMQAASGS